MSGIYGIGVDLVEMQRINGVMERQGEAFLKRVLNDDEIRVYKARSAGNPERGVRFLATRFAAKEAFSKAMGSGIGQLVGFHSLSVLNEENGRPYIELKGELKVFCEKMALQAFVSLADESHCVVAQVVISKSN